MLAQSLLLALVATAAAAPFSSPYVLHEKRSGKLNGRTTRLPSNAIVPIRIGLTQSNLDNQYAHIMDVSDPFSSNYGKHWTKEEVEAMYAPNERTIEAVTDWLIASGIEPSSIASSSNRGWLAANMPVHKAESLFQTHYYEHEDSADGSIRLGCDSYHLPNHIREHIDFVKPGVSLSAPVKKKTMTRRSPRPKATAAKVSHGPYRRSSADTNRTSPDLSNCGNSITPACIRALYDIPIADPNCAVDPANSLGIFEWSDHYSQQDLDAWFVKYAPYVPQGTHPDLVSIDGAFGPAPQNSSEVTGESDVDLTLAYSLIYPQSVVLYQEPDGKAIIPNATNSTRQVLNDITFINTFLDAVDGSYCTDLDRQSGFQCGTSGLTRVVSMSYGSAELDFSMGDAFAEQRACSELGKLTLQGTTFLVSSGDYGVAGRPMQKNNGRITNGCIALTKDGFDARAVNGSIFSASFPATCPYVLSVGATQLNAGESVEDPESVMHPPAKDVPSIGHGVAFSSSGGFSNLFDQPSYQAAAVSSYFDQYDPGYPYYTIVNGTGFGANGGRYNRGGRAIPDVSANGAFLVSIIQGKEGPEFGTSLSTPLWASLITMINEKRSIAGKGPVGFVNPTLYANPDAFHDITAGDNPGCNTNGFPAVPGWEPATGLGTPNYPALLDLFLSLP